MSNRIPDLILLTEKNASGCGALPLVLHPLANEIWARDDTELPVLAFHQITQRNPIQFFKLRQAQQGPQAAFAGGLHQLIEIRQMTVKQLSGNSNSDMSGMIASIHTCSLRTIEVAEPYFQWMLRGNDSCEKSGQRSVNFGNQKGSRWLGAKKSDTGNSLHT